jgi:hypothetical protein
MSKKQINEVNAVSKFIGDFFDGIKTNTSNRFLTRAKQRGIPNEVIQQMEKIQKEKDELEKIFTKYTK